MQAGFTVFSTKYNYNQAREEALLTGIQINVPQAELQNLQNYTQSSKGFTVSAEPSLAPWLQTGGHHIFVRHIFLVTLSEASQNLFHYLEYEGISGPNSLNGIITSASHSHVHLEYGGQPVQRPPRHATLLWRPRFAGLGGTVRSIRPIFQYKHFIPVQKGRNSLAFNFTAFFPDRLWRGGGASV